ncbi:MAG TPA: isoprenylcysteine carboxylmethyltransferase family protein, partial [Terriglobia bacterium]|nr:isoprenylcysteine carboxylmethyltransferase family protein [Terriglobia bacterium]
MKASGFEFRFRAALIGLLYYIGFAVYGYDHTPAVQAMANWILGPHSPHGILLERILIESGALLVAFGAVARTWGAAYLRANIVHDAQLHATELIADGPYRYVRHPLYFGSIVANVGLAFVASRLGFVIIVVMLTLLYVRLAGREEAQLAERQGEPHRAFCEKVPRLWPALRARVPATGAKPQWGQALLGEAFMWGFALA